MRQTCALATALFSFAVAEEIAPAELDSWNATDFCHSPTDPDCEQCCIENPSGSDRAWTVLSWSGDCSKCKPGDPYGPNCANCFPGVQQWYNEESEEATKPAKCKPCSQCLRRVVSDYQQTMTDPISDGPCTCDPTQAPKDRDCSCGAPGVDCCDCYCQYQADIRAYCKLDPDPKTFPRPCVYDKMYNESRGDKFTLECDKDGYYKLEQCGKVAPPKLPPSPPPTQVVASAATQAHMPMLAAEGHRRLQPGSGWCWCTEPTYGVQNGTTAVHAGARADCTHTIQCDLLPEGACNTRKALCNWTYIEFDQGYVCLNLPQKA